MNNGGDVLPVTVLSRAEQLPDEAHSFLSLHLPPGEKSAISPSTIPPTSCFSTAAAAETKHNSMKYQNIIQK